jgi:anti-anti-sigma factor
MANQEAQTPAILFIEGELSIYRAAELKELLLAHVMASQELEVDLGGVTEIDTAGLQLLILAKRTAQALQRELRLTSHSPAVLEIFELLNAAPLFGDPLVILNN